MAKTGPPLAGAPLVRDLHRALLEIYNPGKLARSPLIDLLSLSQQPDPSAALRRLLLQAIEALKPGSEVPAQAEAWLIYEVLVHRYVQQIPQIEIASSLGFSKRQLQRHEAAAIRVLANYLWTRYGLQLRAAPTAASHEVARDRGGSPQGSLQELEWASKLSSIEAVNIADLVQGAAKSIAPLLNAAQVRIETALSQDLPRLAVHTMTMRQALVSVLSTAAHSVPGGCIEITAEARPAEVAIHIRSLRGHAAPRSLGFEDGESLQMARRLVAVSGGSLDLEMEGEAALTATLTLPVAQQLGVLVIDDNVDTLQLYQRYLAGTRYTFVGERDPKQALALAQDLKPKAIVLDVMLPRIDGWEMLGRLREHPATKRIPVIVCSILPNERLALTLGAAGFLRKPVSRGALIEALDGVMHER